MGCVAATSKMAPVIPASWYSHPWVRAESSDSALMNRIWQKWGDVTSKLRLHKDCDFHVICLLLPFLTSSLALREASCHVVSSPMKRPTWQEVSKVSSPQPEKNHVPQSSSPTGTEFCQQPREWVGSGPFPREAFTSGCNPSLHFNCTLN